METKEIQLDFKDVSQTILLFCAFRYALGRRTYVVGTISNIIKANWVHMHQIDREKYKLEIRGAIKDGLAGSKYDIKSWEQILALPD